jgi:3-oxoacyl-[acyl-carrier-protein] synthase III
MSIFARVAGTGSYLPELRLTNQDLVERLSKTGLETSDEWIKTRSGISARHFAAENELTSDLAVKAAEAALSSAGISSEDLDLIILATSTPDHLGGFPSTACVVQDKLGAHTSCAAFDVQAVCAGFTYALAIADAFIRSGSYKKVLVIGAETFSRMVMALERLCSRPPRRLAFFLQHCMLMVVSAISCVCLVAQATEKCMDHRL